MIACPTFFHHFARKLVSIDRASDRFGIAFSVILKSVYLIHADVEYKSVLQNQAAIGRFTLAA